MNVVSPEARLALRSFAARSLIAVVNVEVNPVNADAPRITTSTFSTPAELNERHEARTPLKPLV